MLSANNSRVISRLFCYESLHGPDVFHVLFSGDLLPCVPQRTTTMMMRSLPSSDSVTHDSICKLGRRKMDKICSSVSNTHSIMQPNILSDAIVHTICHVVTCLGSFCCVLLFQTFVSVEQIAPACCPCELKSPALATGTLHFVVDLA